MKGEKSVREKVWAYLIQRLRIVEGRRKRIGGMHGDE
jgi:hypothetical protein